jgi:hypothetical protein
MRHRVLNYLYFDGRTPIDYTLRFVVERTWSHGIHSPQDLIQALYTVINRPREINFGRFPAPIEPLRPTGHPVIYYQGGTEEDQPMEEDAGASSVQAFPAPREGDEDILEPVDVSDPASCRLLHRNTDILTQFKTAFRSRPMIMEMCDRCGKTDKHTRAQCDNDFEPCTWPCCPDPRTHAFYVCKTFLRRCRVSTCRLRGHRSEDHQAVVEGYGRTAEYVRAWERLADNHFVTRIRRLYSPYGCYRVIPELDHLSLQHIYFYSVSAWNSLVDTMERCRDIVEDRDTDITTEDRAQFAREDERHRRHLKSVLRSEIERRVLGREMDRTERAYFVRKYSLRPIDDPQIMEQLVIYLRLREDNQRRSIAYPVFQHEQQQRQPPRPFPPWFNPEAPRTQDRENESGGKTRVCAECTHSIQPQNRELCPYGYCFVCGDPRDPPPDPRRLAKMKIDTREVERELAKRLQGFGRAGTSVLTESVPPGLQVARAPDVLLGATAPTMPRVEPPSRELSSRESRARRPGTPGSSRFASASRSRSPTRARDSSSQRTKTGRIPVRAPSPTPTTSSIKSRLGPTPSKGSCSTTRRSIWTGHHAHLSSTGP